MNSQQTYLAKGEFSIKSVRFRRALLSDFDAILAFGDHYEGRDYFWALYEEFLADPDNLCVVALMEDTVVGYGMTSLIDGGLSAVARCARVDPKFRRRGIFVAILDELEKYTMLVQL
ncbi:histidine N-acetyltransferase-like [Elysia marginata]|uniref:Histidine N-acetyltransferase-like n=1 Tax=Elysia marginata TaxID=1093978 RepID=A0AAV4HEI9_9GAST|nr:histidine N-acetyltransferase-like [Elysia marginata]